MIRRAIILAAILIIMPSSAPAGRDAPAFSVRDDSGRVYTLEQFRGRPLVLFFFTFECPHCRKAMPVMERLYRSGTRVLGVAFSTRYGELAAKLKKTDITFPVGVGTRRIADDYGIRGVPTTILVSAGGDIIRRGDGEAGAAEIAALAQETAEGKKHGRK